MNASTTAGSNRRPAWARAVPLVVISPDAVPATRLLLDAGTAAFLTEPLDLAAFRATVAGLL